MTRVAIHQPAFLPWTDYLLRIAWADFFVFLDSVQYTRRNYQNRNLIKARQGAQWLTVPLRRAPRNQIIAEMRIDNSRDWRTRHGNLIKESYRSAPHFGTTCSLLEPVYACEWDRLTDLNCDWTMRMAAALGAKTQFLRSSELNVEGKGSELILNLCLELGAAYYISGSGGRSYLEEERFTSNGVDVVYVPPLQLQYDQMHPEIGFIPHLSIIDYLFSEGIGEIEKLMKRYEALVARAASG